MMRTCTDCACSNLLLRMLRWSFRVSLYREKWTPYRTTDSSSVSPNLPLSFVSWVRHIKPYDIFLRVT